MTNDNPSRPARAELYRNVPDRVSRDAYSFGTHVLGLSGWATLCGPGVAGLNKQRVHWESEGVMEVHLSQSAETEVRIRPERWRRPGVFLNSEFGELTPQVLTTAIEVDGPHGLHDLSHPFAISTCDGSWILFEDRMRSHSGHSFRTLREALTWLEVGLASELLAQSIAGSVPIDRAPAVPLLGFGSEVIVLTWRVGQRVGSKQSVLRDWQESPRPYLDLIELPI